MGKAPVCWIPKGQYPSSASYAAGRGERGPLPLPGLRVSGGNLMAGIIPLSCMICCVLCVLIFCKSKKNAECFGLKRDEGTIFVRGVFLSRINSRPTVG